MTLPRPTIVILDMDGTTVRHVNPRLLGALEWADDVMFGFHRFWTRMFKRVDKATVIGNIGEYGRKKKPRLLVHRALHKVRRKPVEQIVQPCPGIYAILTLLKARGIPTGLVSNGLGKGYGHDVLKTFDLEGYFASTVFREDISHSKPNPEGILKSIKSLKAEPGADDVVWYIGDRHKDIRAALAAQKHLPCRIVPVACALNAAVAVIEHNIGPDHIFMTHYDLYDALEQGLG